MDYKSTLNLPKTDFPMKANLPQKEPERLAWWEAEGIYQLIQRAREGKPLYILHDGPPYANGHIHIGHALNKILKDIIVKSKTMSGYQVPYVPGWDCHGLPIEHQVTKQLGPKKKELSAVDLRKLCREYAEKFVAIQRDEFRRLGVFGDWEHPYLTMNPEYEATIIREFGKFVEKGRVYKGLKPVLWCMVDQTALAEAEVEYEEHSSPSVYVRFPLTESPSSLVQGKWGGIPGLDSLSSLSVVIWTTTPWTLPANQAVCLHPDFEYVLFGVGQEGYVVAEGLLEPFIKACGLDGGQILGKKLGKEFEGLTCHPPFSKRMVPILNGDFVTLEQGTGCVHIAPGHGMDDYLLALKYNKPALLQLLPDQKPLEVFVPVDDAGRFTVEFPECTGQSVLEANPVIIEHLQERGRLVGKKNVAHSYPHCWRCKQPVIFRATHQWFVSMEEGELRRMALKEIDQVRWIPPRGRERIYGMIENRPDWCLSRQRMWGTPIPVFTCRECGKPLADAQVIAYVGTQVQEGGADIWFSRSAAELVPAGTTCSNCGSTAFKKEQDILDVWFESGVSHAAVLKVKAPAWWPADLYLEGSDQHRGWFHSALLTAVTTDGRAPYRAVLTHGFVVDGEGKKMSKSAGNVVTPQEVIKDSGAEILRLWVASQDYQEDLRISKDILKQLIEAYRKVRNTCRFLLSNLYDFDVTLHAVPHDQLPELDQWALWRLGQLITNVRRGYDQFQFRQVIHEIDYFCSTDMSATYLDILKDRLYTFPSNSSLRRGSQTVLREIVTSLAKLMAPILSFTAEEIWQVLPEEDRNQRPSIHMAEFPEAPTVFQSQEMQSAWGYLLKVRGAVQLALETKRREKVIGSSLDAQVVLQAIEPHFGLLERYRAELPALFIVSSVVVKPIPSLVSEGEAVREEALGICIDVRHAPGKKCERCWNIREEVGRHTAHPALCGRCVEAIG